MGTTPMTTTEEALDLVARLHGYRSKVDDITAAGEMIRALVAERDEAQAKLAQVRELLPGPRSFADYLARDFQGNLFPRMIDADKVAAILAQPDDSAKEAAPSQPFTCAWLDHDWKLLNDGSRDTSRCARCGTRKH